ncbi:MAG: TOBE domain-containing protein [Rhodobacterales bacterium]|nr:TOBE domain-containing protein [Rhodobacterales bacterium]
MKLSARNVLKGKVAGLEPGAVTTIVRIDLGGGVIVTSSITKAAAEDLNLAVGDEAYAVIKASDVLVGKP